MVILFLAQNIEITKKTASLKNKIITSFVKHLHRLSRSLVEIKKFVGVHL